MRRQLREKFSSEMLLRPASVTVPSNQRIFLERVTRAIEEHLEDESFNVEELGRAVGLSRAQLHRKLRALTNKAPNELIRSFRLQRAAELIRQESGTFAEIAYHVGFGSQAYFTRCFQEEFGRTPSEYRKNAAGPAGS
jgi:AraC-like DNA-binding protein